MDHQTKYMNEIEENYVAVNIEEEESNEVEYEDDVVEGDGIDTRWCLVGKFPVDIPMNFKHDKKYAG